MLFQVSAARLVTLDRGAAKQRSGIAEFNLINNSPPIGRNLTFIKKYYIPISPCAQKTTRRPLRRFAA